jgi:membrane-associated phospholipid phosphatase
MFGFEWITVVYVSGRLLKAIAVRSVPALLVGAATLSAVAVAVPLASTDVRTALPVLYILVGYWLPGLLVQPGRSLLSERFEAWLARTDAAIRPRLPGVPRPLVQLTEGAYLFCYPMVPIAFVLAWTTGTTADLDRLWVSVLGSGFLSYATLPWIFSKPPRARMAGRETAHGAKWLNGLILRRLSHGWNTFPSGHVAVSWAAAWSVWHIWPEAGASLAVVSAAISIGAAAGGYHYVIDVVAGWATAAAVVALAW